MMSLATDKIGPTADPFPNNKQCFMNRALQGTYSKENVFKV